MQQLETFIVFFEKNITYNKPYNQLYFNAINMTTNSSVTIQAKGNPLFVCGQKIIIYGVVKQSSMYGSYIRASEMVSDIQLNSDGLRNFFSSKSSFCKGITTKIIDTLIEKTGSDWYMLFVDNKWDVIAVHLGLSEEKKIYLEEEWKKSQGYFSLHMAFSKHPVSPFSIKKLYKLYGLHALEMMHKDPYSTMQEVGIGFKTADKIARDFGVTPRDERRLKAASYFLLDEYRQQGHTFIDHVSYYSLIKTLCNIELLDDEIKHILSILHNQKIIKTFIIGDTYGYCFFHDWMCEFQVASWIINHQKNLMKKVEVVIDDQLFSDEQKDAIRGVFDSSCSVITGGPGTGKTTIIKSIYNTVKKNNLRSLLLAPTGRAAQRIEESVAASASTIHRALGFKKMYLASKKEIHSFQPLLYDVIIIDESSMIDIYMMYALIKSVGYKTRLIFVGDVNQLPSVGCGNVLKDLIDSKAVTVFRLKKIFRQKEDALLLPVAHSICHGLIPKISQDQQSDCVFVSKNKEEALESCKDIATQWYDVKSNQILIQFITTMNRGVVGAYSLNKMAQQLCASKRNYTFKDQILGFFYVGDKVMQIINNYDLEVFNGDIGIIIEGNKEECTVQFIDKTCIYSFQTINQLTLAYAITTHKSQGSEFPIVCIPILMEQYIMLNRQGIYTAITRSKEKCIVVGEWKALCCGIKKEESIFRNTLLNHFLNQ
jgi:exodeoxyribonuclease V alpha subunit